MNATCASLAPLLPATAPIPPATWLPTLPVPVLPGSAAALPAPLVFALPKQTEPPLAALPIGDEREDDAGTPTTLSSAANLPPPIFMLMMTCGSNVHASAETAPPVHFGLKEPEAKIDATSVALRCESPVQATNLPTSTFASALDVTAKPVPASNVVEQLNTWIAQAEELGGLTKDVAELANPSRNLAFRLEGPRLGPVDIQMHSSDAGVSVGFKTACKESGLAIAQAQHSLVEDLRSTGLRVSGTQVSTDAGTSRHERPPDQRQVLIEASSAAIDQPPSLQNHVTITPAESGRFA
jgi:hypothetical protein